MILGPSNCPTSVPWRYNPNTKGEISLVKSLIYMVPGVGLEPTRCCHRGILSPLRLPISPPGRVTRWALNHPCSRMAQPVMKTSLLKIRPTKRSDSSGEKYT